MCENSVLVLVSNPRMPISIVGLMPLIAITKAQLHEPPHCAFDRECSNSVCGEPSTPFVGSSYGTECSTRPDIMAGPRIRYGSLNKPSLDKVPCWTTRVGAQL